jgi:hypothetical protein
MSTETGPWEPEEERFIVLRSSAKESSKKTVKGSKLYSRGKAEPFFTSSDCCTSLHMLPGGVV